MSETQGGPEYLEQSGGAALTREPSARSRKPLLLAGAGVLGLAVVGGAAFGAYWYFSDGAQAAEALPSSAIAYAGITLDPSGQQKLAALETLKRFPALSDELDLDGDVRDIDIKAKLGEAFLSGAPCDGLTYADDLEPWLGDRIGVAAVPVDDQPIPVVAIETTDGDAADQALADFRDCGGGDASSPAWTVSGDWVLITEDAATLSAVEDQLDDGTLADDETFQRWTGEAGDPGVATLYAAPAAATYAGDLVGDVLGSGGADQELTDRLADFDGMAAQVRFADGSVEVEAAGDAGGSQSQLGDHAADLVTGLPDDTVVALGGSFADGWTDALPPEASDFLGELPDVDLQGLLGDAAALALGPGLDLGDLFASMTPPDLPLALVTTGDLDAARTAADQLATGLLGVDARVDGEDGHVVIGLDDTFHGAVVDGGDLGGTDAFSAAVPDADGAGALLFVDFDAISDVVGDMSDGDQEVTDNLAPLRALGLSVSTDDSETHALLRLTTDEQ